jgi:hypothetical protein
MAHIVKVPRPLEHQNRGIVEALEDALSVFNQRMGRQLVRVGRDKGVFHERRGNNDVACGIDDDASPNVLVH